MDRARATLPRFVEKFRSPHEYGTFMFKVQIEDGDDRLYLWLRLEDVEGEELVGVVFAVPPEISRPAAGEKLRVTFDEVYDWSIARSGTLVGGYSRRLQRSRMGEAQELAFDLYSGIAAYSPLAELEADRGYSSS